MKQVLIAIDQLVNALCGGFADETISSRCWRLRHKQPYTKLRAIIDCAFFWQNEHCRTAHESELKRLQSPPSQRI